MLRNIVLTTIGGALILLPITVFGAFDTFTVSTWGYGDLTIPDIIANVYDVAKATIAYASVAVFAYGAFRYATSAGVEAGKSEGTKAMKGAIFGLVIVIAAEGFIRLASLFVWG